MITDVGSSLLFCSGAASKVGAARQHWILNHFESFRLMVLGSADGCPIRGLEPGLAY